MYRFFISSENITGDCIKVSDKAQAHHIRDVLRLKEREKIIVFDEKGNEYLTSIEKLSSFCPILEIEEKLTPHPARKIRITIACAIPKKSKMEDIIDKLTQLGVHRIIPLVTQRTVVKLDRQKESGKLKRWLRIAQNASEQCQRVDVPVIEKATAINKVLSGSSGFDLKLIPALTGERKSLKEIFLNSDYKNALILIGPEGDFTPEEVALAKSKGFIPVSLGELVLRVETAAIAVASFVKLLSL